MNIDEIIFGPISDEGRKAMNNPQFKPGDTSAKPSDVVIIGEGTPFNESWAILESLWNAEAA